MKWEECYPGQIVFIRHYDEFLKKYTSHPYLVYGKQGFHSKKKKNIICLRITTHLEDMEDKLPIHPSICNSLDKESAIVYNAEHLFDVNNALLIGQCEWDVFDEVIDKRRRYLDIQNTDALQALKNMKKYQEIVGKDKNPNYFKRLRGEG